MTSQDAESFFSDVQSLPADNDIFSMLTCIYKSQQGFSELWKARHKGKWVVLKCVRKEYASSVLAKEMLAKEYQTGYPLQHPNIVTMLDFTQVPPLGDCIVEEYVDGMTLAEFIRKGQAADSDIKRILMQTVGAVGYLHQRQLIHHDLKPANIIITHNGGNVKLIDFGLSRTDDDASPQPVAGTVHYVATEMMEGKQSAAGLTSIRWESSSRTWCLYAASRSASVCSASPDGVSPPYPTTAISMPTTCSTT